MVSINYLFTFSLCSFYDISSKSVPIPSMGSNKDQIKIKSVQSDFIGLPQIEHVEAVPKKGHHAHVTRWQDAEQREMVRRMVRRILRK